VPAQPFSFNPVPGTRLRRLVGLRLGFGLLSKRRFALVLVYVMVDLALLLVAIKIPVAATERSCSQDRERLKVKLSERSSPIERRWRGTSSRHAGKGSIRSFPNRWAEERFRWRSQ